MKLNHGVVSMCLRIETSFILTLPAKAVFIFFIFLLFAGKSFAGSSDLDDKKSSFVKGKVIDRLSNDNIEFANIALYKASSDELILVGTSDVNGAFMLKSINDGSYYLKVSFIGFESFTSPEFNLGEKDHRIQLGTIGMEPDNTEIEGIDVNGKKRSVVLQLDKKIIDPSNMSSAAGGSAIDVLERAPSVTVDVEGNVSLRGSSNFRVLIDGRPTLMSSTMALQQMPVSQIKNIEIITNPSARYDAEGDAGIININTKNTGNEGVTGLVDMTGSTYGSYGANVLFGIKKNNFLWRIGGNLSDSKRIGEFEQIKETLLNDTTHRAASQGERTGHNYNSSLKAGFTYFQSKSTFDFDLEGGDRGFGYLGDLNYHEQRSAAGQRYFEDTYDSYDYKDLNEDFLSGNFAFHHWFDSKDHYISGSLFASYGYSLEYFENELTATGNQQIDGQRSWEEEYRVTIQAKVDYVRPLNDNKGKFEAGYQFFSYVEDGDYGMEDFSLTKNDYVWQEDYYSVYRFERPVQSIYSVLSNRDKKLGYQLGVRGEYTHRILESSEVWASHKQNRFELFPSLHLSYDSGKEQQIRTSYSRRTVRPSLHFLEPYVTFADSYTARTGNPDVRPEYINSFELGYQKYFGKESNFIAVDAFHRRKKDKIERIRTVYAPNITLDSISNVGDDYSSGLEAMGSYTLNKWWTLDASASLFYYRIDSKYKTAGVDEESINWEARFSNYFTLANGCKIQFDGNYVGPSVSTQGVRAAFFYTNLSLKQQVLKKAITLTLTARDVLSTARFKNTQTGENLYSSTHVQPRSPLIILSASYRINDLKKLKREKGSTDDLFEGSGH